MFESWSGRQVRQNAKHFGRAKRARKGEERSDESIMVGAPTFPHGALVTITIRDAIPADGKIIATFNSRLSDETEGGPLNANIIGLGVVALLADSNKGRYWVAEVDGQIVGQIMVTYEWSDWRNGMLWWIQSVYVHADYRRTGVFSNLYRHVESLADADPGVVGIRLYVEKDNLRAQATYDKLGMSMTDYHVMQVILDHNRD